MGILSKNWERVSNTRHNLNELQPLLYPQEFHVVLKCSEAALSFSRNEAELWMRQNVSLMWLFLKLSCDFSTDGIESGNWEMQAPQFRIRSKSLSMLVTFETKESWNSWWERSMSCFHSKDARTGGFLSFDTCTILEYCTVLLYDLLAEVYDFFIKLSFFR